MSAFRLPGTVVRMTPVAGAWSNRVHRLETTEGAYAVKELLDPWGEERRAERLAQAFDVELAAIASGVPAPEPVPAPGGGPSAAVPCPGGPDVLVRVHRWAAGVPPGPGPVAAEVAAWAGRVLARLHRLHLRPRERTVFAVPNTAAADAWPALADVAWRAGAPWAGAVAAVLPEVATIAELVQAGDHRPDDEVMSHADIDQKNLLLSPAGSLLCDWDVASPVVPRRELAHAALSLACWRSPEIARTVVTAYGAAAGDVPAFVPADLGAPLATVLDWIALNAECALRLRPATDERRRLAEALVVDLLAELPARVRMALDVRATLSV